MDLTSIAGLLTIAVQYGPNAISAFSSLVKLWPAIKALLALIGTHTDAGLSVDDAVTTVAGQIRGLHKMTPEEEQQWFNRASQTTGL